MTSRFDDYDGEGAVPEGLWQASLQRATQGRRGQALLRELRAALLALPTHALAHGALVKDEGATVCVIGALGAYRAMQAGASYQDALATLPHLQEEDADDIMDTCVYARDILKMAWTLAWELTSVNDEDCKYFSPAERWLTVFRWVEARITGGFTDG